METPTVKMQNLISSWGLQKISAQLSPFLQKEVNPIFNQILPLIHHQILRHEKTLFGIAILLFMGIRARSTPGCSPRYALL
jgi:hypothetical protein